MFVFTLHVLLHTGEETEPGTTIFTHHSLVVDMHLLVVIKGVHIPEDSVTHGAGQGAGVTHIRHTHLTPANVVDIGRKYTHRR